MFFLVNNQNLYEFFERSVEISESIFLIHSQTEASLFLTREFAHDESIKDEDIMYSYCTYIAENAESLNLVEGEKVYVLGKLIFN